MTTGETFAIINNVPICGRSSSGRAPPCQGGGSEFEPRRPLQKKKPSESSAFSFRTTGSNSYFVRRNSEGISRKSGVPDFLPRSSAPKQKAEQKLGFLFWEEQLGMRNWQFKGQGLSLKGQGLSPLNWNLAVIHSPPSCHSERSEESRPLGLFKSFKVEILRHFVPQNDRRELCAKL